MYSYDCKYPSIVVKTLTDYALNLLDCIPYNVYIIDGNDFSVEPLAKLLN